MKSSDHHSDASSPSGHQPSRLERILSRRDMPSFGAGSMDPTLGEEVFLIPPREEGQAKHHHSSPATVRWQDDVPKTTVTTPVSRREMRAAPTTTSALPDTTSSSPPARVKQHVVCVSNLPPRLEGIHEFLFLVQKCPSPIRLRNIVVSNDRRFVLFVVASAADGHSLRNAVQGTRCHNLILEARYVFL